VKVKFSRFVANKKAVGFLVPRPLLNEKTAGPFGGAHGILFKIYKGLSRQARLQMKVEPPPITL
jgi:hypothetical protein